VRGWWLRRSVRARIVLSAAVPLSVALVVGSVAVAAVFTAGRIHDLDQQTQAEADQVSALVSSGQLPTTLPVPAGSTLLVQVLGTDGAVLAAGPSASRIAPLAPVDITGRVSTDEEGSYAGVPLRLRTMRAGDRTVVVAAPLGDVRRALHALRLVLLLVVPLLLVTVAMVLWWVVGLALRPVDRLVAQQERFVADAAHELRSPLTALRLQLDVAREHPTAIDVPQLLDDLEDSTQRMGRLVEDLLALARWTGGRALRRSPVDLTELAGALGPPVIVHGDQDALKRLVDNLLANAHRHAGTVRVTTSLHSGTAVLDVDDDGPGIAEADRSRVFERWVRLDDARTRAGGGAGLGLALVREVARMHGGKVSVQDSPLGGARLHVELPHHPRAAE
jgi:signal transduction histidine kinase